MGEPYQSTKQLQKSSIICCPICGESLPESPIEPIDKCPKCEFDLVLIRLSPKKDIPQTSPAHVPIFSLIILGLQTVLGGLFSILYLFFASPLYGNIPLLLAAINIISIPLIAGFVIVLRTQKATRIVKIALVVFGIATLPLGVCAFTAAFGIVPIQRWCILCGKKIGWSSYIECPNCRTSTHRWGKCRIKRLQIVATSLGSELSSAQLEYVCPNCFQPMNQHDLGGKTDE